MTRANNAPWFTKADAASGIMPLSHFVGSSIFALKGGGYGRLFSVEGIDPESRTDEDLEVRVRGVEAALRGLPPGACLYQYTRVIAGYDLPRQHNTQTRLPNLSPATGLRFSIRRPAFGVATCTGASLLSPTQATRSTEDPGNSGTRLIGSSWILKSGNDP